MTEPTFVRAYPSAQPAPGAARWLLFRDGALLLRESEDGLTLLRTQDLPAEARPDGPVYLGTLGGVPCLAAEIAPDAPIPSGLTALSLRALYGKLSETEYALAGYASQILYWRRTSRFCPVCGHATEDRAGDWGRLCPQCGHVGYPRVSPAVLILVHDGEKILLAHKPGWGNRFSILAGFVEPSESLEECVRREVLEEVRVTVTDLVYTGSQAWPFPHQLMVGFTARYLDGAIQVDENELDEARWFCADALPDLPSPVSLSRQMIDAWVAERS